jgi:hypothetical protein
VIPAAAAAVLYGAVLAYSLHYTGRFMPVLGAFAAAGGLVFFVAVWRAAQGMLGWSLLLAGIVYIAALEVRGGRVDGTAPLVATGLFLAAELARWSFDMRVRISGDTLLVARRAEALTALAFGAASASAVVVGVSTIGAPRAVGWTALGAAAAAGAIGLGVWLARR